jgi:ribonuclease P protein subunit POP4
MSKKKKFPYELVGEELEVVDSTNKADLGIKGKVVDETKATLKVEQGDKIKTLLKNNITFKLVRTGQIINGQEIAKRSEERLTGR